MKKFSMVLVLAVVFGFVVGGFGGVQSASADCHRCKKRVRPKPRKRACVRCVHCTHRVVLRGCAAGYKPAGRDLMPPWKGRGGSGRDLMPPWKGRGRKAAPKRKPRELMPPWRGRKASPRSKAPAPKRVRRQHRHGQTDTDGHADHRGHRGSQRHHRHHGHRRAKVIVVPKASTFEPGWRFRLGIGGLVQGLNLGMGVYLEPRLQYIAEGGFTYEASLVGTLLPGSWTLRDGALGDYVFRGNVHIHPLGLGWTHHGPDSQRIAILGRVSMGLWNWLHNPRAPSPRLERLDFGGEVLARFTLAGGRVQLEPFLRLSYCAIRWPGHQASATTEATEGSSLPWLLTEFGIRLGVVFP